jgi:hypothetical protein
MNALRIAAAGAAAAAIALGAAAPAMADPDTDFAAELHTYGIYGQKDYNAWIGKLSCKRLRTGVDATAFDTAKFLGDNLARDTSPQQHWDFLNAAINTYCPENRHFLEEAAAQR